MICTEARAGTDLHDSCEKYAKCDHYILETACGAGLLGAVRALRAALRQRGSELVIRSGALQAVLPGLARQTGAYQIVAEEEVEHRYTSR